MIRLSAGGQPRVQLEESYPLSWQAFIGPCSEAYYAGGVVNGEALTAQAVTALRIIASPWIAPREKAKATILTLSTTVGVAGNVRLGLYASKGRTTIYPGALLADSGNISTAVAGVLSYTIPTPIDLVPGALYWVVSVFDAAPTVRSLGLSRMAMDMLGNPVSGFGSSTDALAYELTIGALGALPDPFTAAAAFRVSPAGLPIVGVGVA